MTVYLDVSAAVHARSGLGRYAESLARALLAQYPEQLTLFFNQDATIQPLAGLDHVPRRTIRAGYKRWRTQVWIGQLLRQNFGRLLPGATLYHATEHLLMPLSGIPTLLTIHDLIFRHFRRGHKLLNWAFLNLTVPLFCRRADAIVAVSEHTKTDLVRFYRLPPEKITVIYEAAAPKFVPQPPDKIEQVRQRYGLPEYYLLTVCVIEPKKNHTGFLHAFEQFSRAMPDLYWAIVGSKGWLYESFFGALENSPARTRVILPGYIADADLPAVYAGAQAFVFPSLHEGFGLPPLEAMACGTPVLSSDRSSLPEVCGDAAVYFDPRNTDSMAAAVRRVLADPSLRQSMSGHGLEQAEQFSWAKAASETWQLYQTLQGQHLR
ncbi:MAG: glycosyltransferase family 4 protein [Anaerolineae bacterium]|nr:glycosyltransferase family 4 protein [Anaerolineae bacterium]